ncbi:MAG: C69 family dipeptidase [Prevotellaceae bacterium]|jgi:dipeptidase|nr:C69 family dipeptidase [Prevotellaceae bacterium]
MKKTIMSIILISAITVNLRSQCDDKEFYGSCTSITVGKKASADGSIITSHTCDGRYRTWMDIVPAQKHKKGATTKILKGTLFTESMDEITQIQLAKNKLNANSDTDSIADFEVSLKVKGEIPEAEETFAFLYTAYPCMNEKNLAIGETTIEGRKELENENGMFYIEELQRIVLQRCTTARQAILLMGKLVKDYGYADTGECLTIADENEVWQFELFGEGKDKIGGVWAAQRIPDDHVGVSANIPRIAEINLDDKDNFMASDNVFEVAKKLNLWDGKSTFKFWKAYSGKKPFSIREWFVLSSVAPSLGLSMKDEELPFSVKPEKAVSVRDVLKFFRSTYEGTEYDMTKNLLIKRKKQNSEEMETVKSDYANPWFSTQMISSINAIKDSTVVRVRNIAVPQCSYAHVIQIRSWLPDEIACVAYFTNDNPAQSPRIPVYANILQTPESFRLSGHKRFIENTSAWIYRQTNKLATIRWQESRKKLEKMRDDFEDKLFDEQNKIDSEATKILTEQGKQSVREYLTKYLNDFSQKTLDAWAELRNELWYTFIRGL